MSSTATIGGSDHGGGDMATQRRSGFWLPIVYYYYVATAIGLSILLFGLIGACRGWYRSPAADLQRGALRRLARLLQAGRHGSDTAGQGTGQGRRRGPGATRWLRGRVVRRGVGRGRRARLLVVPAPGAPPRAGTAGAVSPGDRMSTRDSGPIPLRRVVASAQRSGWDFGSRGRFDSSLAGSGMKGADRCVCVCCGRRLRSSRDEGRRGRSLDIGVAGRQRRLETAFACGRPGPGGGGEPAWLMRQVRRGFVWLRRCPGWGHLAEPRAARTASHG